MPYVFFLFKGCYRFFWNVDINTDSRIDKYFINLTYNPIAYLFYFLFFLFLIYFFDRIVVQAFRYPDQIIPITLNKILTISLIVHNFFKVIIFRSKFDFDWYGESDIKKFLSSFWSFDLYKIFYNLFQRTVSFLPYFVISVAIIFFSSFGLNLFGVSVMFCDLDVDKIRTISEYFFFTEFYGDKDLPIIFLVYPMWLLLFPFFAIIVYGVQNKYYLNKVRSAVCGFFIKIFMLLFNFFICNFISILEKYYKEVFDIMLERIFDVIVNSRGLKSENQDIIYRRGFWSSKQLNELEVYFGRIHLFVDYSITLLSFLIFCFVLSLFIYSATSHNIFINVILFTCLGITYKPMLLQFIYSFFIFIVFLFIMTQCVWLYILWDLFFLCSSTIT